MRKHNVLVVDDHPIVRQGLKQLINREQDFVVCGEAENVGQALKAIKTLKPDIVTMDLSFRGVITYEVFHEMKLRYPDLPILALSMHEETVHAERVLRAGARGYIMKHEATDRVITAIHTVLDGGIYLSEKMAGKVLKKLVEGQRKQQCYSVQDLTDRELEVFRLIGQGYGTRQISELLCLSPKTIESHREHIKEKLNLTDAQELHQYAIQWLFSNKEG